MNTASVRIIMGALAIAGALGAAVKPDTISLAGTWRFSLDAAKEGVAQGFFKHDLTGRIPLPGTTDEAKAGLPNPNKPSLDGLYRPNVYVGPAWYQRDIDIPAAWSGKQVTLFLERTHWDTRVWVDDADIGAQDSLVAPHVYDLGTHLSPGRHRLTICVDNTKKLDLGRFASINYEGTQTNWNGIVGAIELRAKDAVSISTVDVYPDVAHKSAKVKVAIVNLTGHSVSGRLKIGAMLGSAGSPVAQQEASFTAEGASTVIESELPLGEKTRLWDEFDPALYHLNVAISSGKFADSKTVTFGMRDFGARGKQFVLNGRTIFLRGTLECAIFPKTAYPPTDVASWRRIYSIIKSYGLNHMRFHSWCPPEAAFTAADMEGIILQAEGPQANVQEGVVPARDAFLQAEMLRMVRTYGNHPSFCLMTPGNEFGGSAELMTKWIDMLIHEDPRHLYSSASNNMLVTPNRQFTVRSWPRGVKGPGTAVDFRDALAKEERPLIGHEIGQWTFYPNFEEAKKYTGVLEARNFDLVRESLAAKHMSDLAPRFVQATGQHAVLLYKEEMELLMRTPSHAGFALLDLHDYPGQGTALIGLLDPFWDSKGFITPEAHRRYAGSTVPLARMKKRTFTADETFSADVDVLHYGPQPLTSARPRWTIADERGRVIASGALAETGVPTGKLSSLGSFSTSLADVPAPAKLKLTVALEGTPFANDWDIWVYPAAKEVAPPADVLITREWTEAASALKSGRKVLLFPTSTNREMSKPGSFLPVFWSSVWFPRRQPSTMGILCDPKHPALTRFPTEFYSNWQWYELLQNSRTMSLDDTPANYRPIVQVIDTFERNGKLGNLFEAKVGQGSLLVATMDLPTIADQYPAARQMLRSLYAYVGSPEFRPAQELDSELLRKMFTAAPAASSGAMTGPSPSPGVKNLH